MELIIVLSTYQMICYLVFGFLELPSILWYTNFILEIEIKHTSYSFFISNVTVNMLVHILSRISERVFLRSRYLGVASWSHKVYKYLIFLDTATLLPGTAGQVNYVLTYSA